MFSVAETLRVRMSQGIDAGTIAFLQGRMVVVVGYCNAVGDYMNKHHSLAAAAGAALQAQA
jgi:hypothetical protein